uniref:Uncharacterized protein n=1 Tax=Arundo donax TaxID=35708 RepID=A0A0A9CFK8_ARUDO
MYFLSFVCYLRSLLYPSHRYILLGNDSSHAISNCRHPV